MKDNEGVKEREIGSYQISCDRGMPSAEIVASLSGVLLSCPRVRRPFRLETSAAGSSASLESAAAFVVSVVFV